MYSKLLSAFKQPQIMGILNLTEDSFSDGGYYLSEGAALTHAEKLIKAGANILDIGAESTRPGATEIPAELEWQRIAPILTALKTAHPSVLISIDTQKASVAGKAIALGADIINDISALQYDPRMAQLVADAPQVKLILMHIQGRPETMQIAPHYEDVVAEIYSFLASRCEYAEAIGIARARLIVDPGIGFGKNFEHNLLLIKHLDAFHELACPLLLGASRKAFLGQILASDVQHRIGGSLATTMLACLAGVQIIRVHDVFEHLQFIKTIQHICQVGDN